MSSSPWSRSLWNGSGKHTEKRFELHESEISIFQQLCLNKHDENAAIEILLDSPDAKPGGSVSSLNSFSDDDLVHKTRLSPMTKVDSIENKTSYSTTSGNTDIDSANLTSSWAEESGGSSRGSRSFSKKKTNSTEAKKTLLDRLFFKSPKKSPLRNDGSKIPAGSLAMQFPSNENQPPPTIPREDSKSNSGQNPTNDSIARNVFDESFRISPVVQWDTQQNLPWNQPRKMSQRVDSFSNVSSLSGSLATASFQQPASFRRRQSLGIESIQDIRMCLKEMETQLAKASNKGQSVSRQKLMKALFTVADSLEDEDEKSYLKAELEATMKNRSHGQHENSSHALSTIQETVDRTDKDTRTLDSASTDEDEFTQDSSAFDDYDDNLPEDGQQSSSFNLLSFFGVDTENQQAMGEVLDDLLWGDFVSQGKSSINYKQRERSKSHVSKHPSQRERQSHRIVLKTKNHNENGGKHQTSEFGNPSFSQPAKSWWRNQTNSQNGREGTDEVARSDTSYGSDDLLPYLPTSIAVKKRDSKQQPRDGKASRVTPAKNASSCTTEFTFNQPQLVESESRVGFEMNAWNHHPSKKHM